MQELEKKVREYGKRSEWSSLQEYMEDVDLTDVINLIERKMNNPDFESLWNYLLRGFSENCESRKKRFKVVNCCIDTLREKDVNATNANAIITRLCGDLISFKTDELVTLSQLCLGHIQKGNVKEACWRTLLPEILNIVLKRDHIEYNDADLTGFEYKTQVVNSLTFMEWSANIVIPLTSMFIDMPLTKEEHIEITNKLGRYMEKLTPQELPTFIYNFLRFCKHQNSKVIFFRLQHYFGLRIYSKSNPGQSESGSEGMELITDASDEEVIQAESTVLFHIYQSALLGHESIKEYLSFLKNLTKAPEYILHPFQLTMLLCVSTVTLHETTAFTIIKQSISRDFYEAARINESAWLKSMVSETLDLNFIFKQVIEYSAKERDLVLHGLVNISFVLLGVGAALGRESQIVAKQWNLGKYILLTLIQQKPHISNSVLQRLCNEMICNTYTTQHIDCFADFSKRFTLLTLENKVCVVQLMEALLDLANDVSEILDSLIPLTKLSPTLRDHLILLLRKALHSRVTSTRQTAVKGFLKLLTSLKISDLASLSAQLNNSQSSSSMRSVFTQISMNCTVHNSQANIFSNEALCLEVLGILKRCFIQPSEVRAKLYEGLHEAVSKNPEIGGAVLDTLWSHFTNYYISDESISPPLMFEKISSIRDLNAVLEEPIGKLIFCIGLIVLKVLKVDADNISAKKFSKILDSIISRMVKCELVHFELDDGSYLLDILPECQKKIITLKHAMTVYEALIGYRIASWEKTSENYAQDVNALFQGYFRLKGCALDAHRSKKTDKKKKDSNKTSTAKNKDSLQSSRVTQNESSSSKNVAKTKNIKTPDSLLNFKTVTKFLNLLHCNVDFTTTGQANMLKSKNEIHRHIMQAAIYLFQNLKTIKSIEKHKKYYEHSVNVATIIYTRCIERMDEFMDFDPITTVLAAECFQVILNLVCTHYNANLSKFFCDIAGLEDREFLFHISPFIEKYEQLFEMDFNDGTGETDGKKLKLLVISTLAILIQQLPNEATVPTNKFLEWVKTFSTQNTISNKPIAATFLGLWFSNYVRFKSSVTTFEEIVENLTNVFGSLMEEKEGINTFEIVNETTAHACVEKLSAIIKVILDDIDWVINRLKSEFSVVSYSSGNNVEKRKEELKNKERGVCCQLCFVITLLDSICTILIPIGSLSEAILKNVIELYSCLNNLTKYFVSRSSQINPVFQGARFDRVVKLAGKQLLPSINKFILYIEETQKETESHDRKKKSSDTLKNKVLRETKLIPKVVFETEQFSKLVMQLSKKTKIDISKFIGPGTTRDFRIKDINNVLKKSSDPDSSLDKSVTDESMQETVEEEEEEEVVQQQSESGSGDESDAPPTKKSKKQHKNMQ